MLLCDTGLREAMVGTISTECFGADTLSRDFAGKSFVRKHPARKFLLYDALGERQHTIYMGATPEYGKASFLERLEREIGRTKARW